MQVVDISTPSSPRLIGSCDTPDYAWGVAISGTCAYVVDWGSSLQVIEKFRPLEDISYIDSGTFMATVPAGYRPGTYNLHVANPDGGYTVLHNSFTVEQSTLVESDRFIADSWSNQITITWNTLSELDNAGFILWRSEAESSEAENLEYTRITPGIIEAKGGAVLGAEYTYTDNTARPGVTYYYKLEDIDTKGVSTFHGPVSAAIPVDPAGPAGPADPEDPAAKAGNNCYSPNWLGWQPESLWMPLYSTQYAAYSAQNAAYSASYPWWWL